MPREKLAGEEDIVRAILNAHWDVENNRWSSELFKGENISVSRLSILPLREIFEIFDNELGIPPRSVIFAGEINIANLQAIAQNYVSKPTKLTVEEDALPTNKAHAEIPEKITRGLAFEIIKGLKLHPNNPEKSQQSQIIHNNP